MFNKISQLEHHTNHNANTYELTNFELHVISGYLFRKFKK